MYWTYLDALDALDATARFKGKSVDEQHSETVAPPEAPPATDMAVVDDYSVRQQWRDWVSQELSWGRAPEGVAAALVAQGWSEEEAQEFVELVRWETRAERGVRTREQVARVAKGTGRPSLLFGLFGLGPIGSVFRLAESLVRLMKLANRRGRRKVEGFTPSLLPEDRDEQRPGQE